MNGAVNVGRIKSAYDYDEMSPANFICPAVNLEIISSIYWLNPHSIKRKLQGLCVTETEYGKPLRSNCFKHKGCFFQSRFDYVWSKGFYLEIGKGKNITTKDIMIPQESPLILDIDIDAFCRHETASISYLSEDKNNYEGVSGFEKRIDETASILATLPKSDLITIATSHGDGTKECYVPPAMVKEVLRYLDFRLNDLFITFL